MDPEPAVPKRASRPSYSNTVPCQSCGRKKKAGSAGTGEVEMRDPSPEQLGLREQALGHSWLWL